MKHESSCIFKTLYCACKHSYYFRQTLKHTKLKRDIEIVSLNTPPTCVQVVFDKLHSHRHSCFVRRSVFSNNTCSIWNWGLRTRNPSECFDACLRFYRNLIKKQHIKPGKLTCRSCFLYCMIRTTNLRFSTTCSAAACCTTCIVWIVFGLWT